MSETFYTQIQDFRVICYFKNALTFADEPKYN